MAGSTIAATGMRSRANCSRISMSWPRICAGTAIPNGRREAATVWPIMSTTSAGLMRFAELQDAAIVGHSLGGMVSLAYAGTYPEQGVAPCRAGRRLSVGLPAHADSRADVAMDRPARSHRGARTQRVPDDRGGGAAAFGAQQAADAGAGASSGPARRPAGRRRPLSLEVRSLSAGEGAVSAVIGRICRLVVAHYLSHPVDVGRRKLSSRSRGRRPARAFQAGRTAEDRGRRTLASS